MAAASIDELLRVEAQLTRSFAGCVIVFVATIGWTFFIRLGYLSGAAEATWVARVLLLLQLGVYAWYAASAGKAAKVLGTAGWKYVVWILVAPFLALIPIPIVSTIIGASPLSIKFLLGGQLEIAIREESVAELHHGA